MRNPVEQKLLGNLPEALLFIKAFCEREENVTRFFKFLPAGGEAIILTAENRLYVYLCIMVKRIEIKDLLML